METNDRVIKIIKSRRTIRVYKNKKIPHELVDKVLEAGRWAPSAHNIQPWKFIVVSKQKIIRDIADIMLEKERKLLVGFNIIMRETAKCLNNSPLLIAIYADASIRKKFDKFGEPYLTIGLIYEIQSVSFAINNMMLCAHSMGLGSACLGMVLFCEKEINGLLDQKGNLMAILSLGFPDEVVMGKERKSRSEIVKFI